MSSDEETPPTNPAAEAADAPPPELQTAAADNVDEEEGGVQKMDVDPEKGASRRDRERRPSVSGSRHRFEVRLLRKLRRAGHDASARSSDPALDEADGAARPGVEFYQESDGAKQPGAPRPQPSDVEIDASDPSPTPVMMEAQAERRRSSHPALLHATLVEGEVFEATAVGEDGAGGDKASGKETPWWKRRVRIEEVRASRAWCAGIVGLVLAVVILAVVLGVRGGSEEGSTSISSNTGERAVPGDGEEGATDATSPAEDTCTPTATLVGPLLGDQACGVGCGSAQSGIGDNAAFVSSGGLVKALSNLDDEYRYAESTFDMGALNLTSLYDVGAMAISGDTLVVGVPGDDGDTGAIYVFDRTDQLDGNWDTAPLRISPADARPGSRFGSTVKINGNLVAIGAPGERTVYLYRRFGNLWYEDSRVSGHGVLAMMNGVALGVSDTDDREGQQMVMLYLLNPGLNIWMNRHNLTNDNCTGSFGHKMEFPTEKSLLIGCHDVARGAVYYYTLPKGGRKPNVTVTQGEDGEEGLKGGGDYLQGPPRDVPPPDGPTPDGPPPGSDEGPPPLGSPPDGTKPSGPRPGPPPDFVLKQSIDLPFLEGSDEPTENGFVGTSFSVWDNTLLIGGGRPTNKRVYILTLSPNEGLWTKTMVADSHNGNAMSFGHATHVYKDKMIIASRTDAYLYDLRLCKNDEMESEMKSEAKNETLIR